VEFNQYQQTAIKTLQPAAEGTDPVTVPLLGLAGEAGSVATVYKKMLRDGAAFEQGKGQLREELGDVLWYVAALAHRFDLSLDDIAVASIEKIKDRWRTTPESERSFFDDDFTANEQIPRKTVVTFATAVTDNGREVVTVTRADGTPAGDPLTNASRVDDDYRYHDVFHLAHAAVLRWSPVSRFLLGCKRRSRPEFDEMEDGGRAIAIEEGISAMVFSYASRHGYLRDVNRIDHELLTTIGQMTAHLEVGACRAADWEHAILTGYKAWWKLRSQGAGQLELDLEAQTLRVL
jgi:NTP pyrophosphatase (non-canonical NTP hydrolase)